MKNDAPFTFCLYFAMPRAVALASKGYHQLDLAHRLTGQYLGDYPSTGSPDGWAPLDTRKLSIPSKSALDYFIARGLIECEPGHFRFTGGCHEEDIRRKALPCREDKPDTTRIKQDDTPLLWTLKTLQDSFLPDGWTPESCGYTVYQTAAMQQCAQRFHWKRYNVKRGDRVRRCFHTLCVGGSRRLRDQILYQGEQSFTILDLKSCHPVLLTNYMPPEEKSDYIELQGGDIYTDLAPTAERTVSKRSFMQLLAGAIQPNRFELHRGFSERFPLMTAKLKLWRAQNKKLEEVQRIRGKQLTPGKSLDWELNGRTLQSHLQNLEAQVVVDTVVKWAAKNRYPVIPVHDAAMCIPEHAQEIKHELEIAMFLETGLDCVVVEKTRERIMTTS